MGEFYRRKWLKTLREYPENFGLNNPEQPLISGVDNSLSLEKKEHNLLSTPPARRHVTSEKINDDVKEPREEWVTERRSTDNGPKTSGRVSDARISAFPAISNDSRVSHLKTHQRRAACLAVCLCPPGFWFLLMFTSTSLLCFIQLLNGTSDC